MKRTQIQIAIEALKKQRDYYEKRRNEAYDTELAAKKNAAFFQDEIERLEKQIQSLEGTTNES